MKQKLRVLLKETLSHFNDFEKAALSVSEAGIEKQIRQIQSAWFHDFINIDPQTIMAKVTCPVLILQGERDLQVDPQENLQALEQTLKHAGNTHVTTKVFPELNHLFQTADTGLITEYARIQETIAPSVLEAITQWIIE